MDSGIPPTLSGVGPRRRGLAERDAQLPVPEMLALYAARLLVRLDISRAVVVDRDQDPLGIVTMHDLVLGRGAE